MNWNVILYIVINGGFFPTKICVELFFIWEDSRFQGDSMRQIIWLCTRSSYQKVILRPQACKTLIGKMLIFIFLYVSGLCRVYYERTAGSVWIWKIRPNGNRASKCRQIHQPQSRRQFIAARWRFAWWRQCRKLW